VAFAPADAPEIAVSCVIEHAGEGGGAAAAPVVRQVLEAYFNFTRSEKQEDHAIRQEAHLAF
jgi:penicillin-binding protein 2